MLSKEIKQDQNQVPNASEFEGKIKKKRQEYKKLDDQATLDRVAETFVLHVLAHTQSLLGQPELVFAFNS